MFTPEQYRAKAAQYAELARDGNTTNEVREFQTRERSLIMLADNKQWLADNGDKLVDGPDEMAPVTEPSATTEATMARERGLILQCLGAALIMEWNTLPPGLQRDLINDACSKGKLLDTTTLSGQIARFLRKHTNGGEKIERPSVQ
jgi:hypothetical protein